MQSWNEKEVFLRALDLNGDELDQFLQDHCPDESRADRIRQLLARAHSRQQESESKNPVDCVDQIDEFEIIRTLGSGGSGVVYLARDTILRRNVALKVLYPGGHHSEEIRVRFRREAQAAAKLHHSSIVGIYRYFESDENAYLVNEFVDGPDWGKLIASEQSRQSHSDSAEGIDKWIKKVCLYIEQIARGLDEAHQAGIVHRDVKPSNILIENDTTAKLTDFGIAHTEQDSVLTQTTGILGSCHYMSPEQAIVAGTKVDCRSDVFSLGVVLYESLTLDKPFDGQTVTEVLRALTSSEPVRVRSKNHRVSRDLETICHKALAKSADDRYQTAAHFAADMYCYLNGHPILARPPSALQKCGRLLYKRRTILALGGIAAVGSFSGIRVYQLMSDKRPQIQTDHIDPEFQISYSIIDLRTGLVGAQISLGAAGHGSFRVPSGYIRVCVQSVSSVFVEYTRYLNDGESFELPAWSGNEQVASDMVFISRKAVVSTSSHLEQAEVDGLEMQQPDFWIDRYEVTNAQYAVFIAESNGARLPPEFWQEIDVLQWREANQVQWNELPVVGVSFYEAQSFAEWTGKRLPTLWEWRQAATGWGENAYAWGGTNPDEYTGKVNWDNTVHPESWVQYPPNINAEIRSAYLNNAWGRSKPHGDWTENTGIAHLMGNVAEWTETIPGAMSLGQRRVMNNFWTSRAQPFGDDDFDIEASDRKIGLGFRCAKSKKEK